jgi:uncharacterized cofD-like protein
VHSVIKWLYPGIGIKRWVGLGACGVVLVVVGTIHLRSEQFWVLQALDAVIVICGIIMLILGIKRLMRSFIMAYAPSSRDTELVDLLFQKRFLSRGPRIVTIGGGTGLAVLLSGLKEYTSNITAIVTVADDGGSSGRLREQFDILPPGDIRNCLVALADAPALMQELFQFRFDSSSELGGHSFGNLFITVMTRLTGDFDKAIRETSKVLALRGRVIPATLNKVVLAARYADGAQVVGEKNIPQRRQRIQTVELQPAYAEPTEDALKAIEDAQMIILGPGSVYTSIIPNLLVRKLAEALSRAQAPKVHVCNVMTQPGETEGYSASEHVRALVSHSNPRVVNYCVVNTGEIPQHILKRYAQENSYPVVNDRKKVEQMGYRVIEDDFSTLEGDVIRHDPVKLARLILGLLEEI